MNNRLIAPTVSFVLTACGEKHIDTSIWIKDRHVFSR